MSPQARKTLLALIDGSMALDELRKRGLVRVEESLQELRSAGLVVSIGHDKGRPVYSAMFNAALAALARKDEPA